MAECVDLRFFKPEYTTTFFLVSVTCLACIAWPSALLKEDVPIFQLLPALMPSSQGPSHTSTLLCIFFLRIDQNRRKEAGLQEGRRVEREQGQAGASVVGNPSLLTLLTTVA